MGRPSFSTGQLTGEGPPVSEPNSPKRYARFEAVGLKGGSTTQSRRRRRRAAAQARRGFGAGGLPELRRGTARVRGDVVVDEEAEGGRGRAWGGGNQRRR
jgi:hypothetical protein